MIAHNISFIFNPTNILFRLYLQFDNKISVLSTHMLQKSLISNASKCKLLWWFHQNIIKKNLYTALYISQSFSFAVLTRFRWNKSLSFTCVTYLLFSKQSINLFTLTFTRVARLLQSLWLILLSIAITALNLSLILNLLTVFNFL